jgi:hypothetical protein
VFLTPFFSVVVYLALVHLPLILSRGVTTITFDAEPDVAENLGMTIMDRHRWGRAFLA